MLPTGPWWQKLFLKVDDGGGLDEQAASKSTPLNPCLVREPFT